MIESTEKWKSDDANPFPFGAITPAIVVDVNKALIRFRGSVAQCEAWISIQRNREEESGTLPDDCSEYEVEPDSDAINKMRWDIEIGQGKRS